MMIGAAEVAVIWAIGSTAGSMLFFGTLQLGRLLARMERVEKDIVGINKVMDSAGKRMSDLADDVQKMPERFIERREAMTWRGSRAEDKV